MARLSSRPGRWQASPKKRCGASHVSGDSPQKGGISSLSSHRPQLFIAIHRGRGAGAGTVHGERDSPPLFIAARGRCGDSPRKTGQSPSILIASHRAQGAGTVHGRRDSPPLRRRRGQVYTFDKGDKSQAAKSCSVYQFCQTHNPSKERVLE